MLVLREEVLLVLLSHLLLSHLNLLLRLHAYFHHLRLVL